MEKINETKNCFFKRSIKLINLQKDCKAENR